MMPVMTHPTVPVPHPAGGTPLDIDTLLVPVIRALWALGIDTVDSCQDIGEALKSRFADVPGKAGWVSAREGRAEIGFASTGDAEMFMNAIVAAGQRDDDFHFRATHWAAPRCWEWSVSMLDTGLIEAAQDEDMTEDDLESTEVVPPEFLSMWPQVYLPTSDLPEVARRLTEIRRSG